jgi:hypothetical protein
MSGVQVSTTTDIRDCILLTSGVQVSTTTEGTKVNYCQYIRVGQNLGKLSSNLESAHCHEEMVCKYGRLRNRLREVIHCLRVLAVLCVTTT